MKKLKEQKCWDWLMGKNIPFPLFKDLPEVPYPINYTEPLGHPDEDAEYDASVDLEDERQAKIQELGIELDMPDKNIIG